MPGSPVPSDDGYAVIPLHEAQGKALQAIHAYQMEEALALDLQFQDGMALELIFRVGFQASATLLEYCNGDARVLKRVQPIRRDCASAGNDAEDASNLQERSVPAAATRESFIEW